MPVARFVCPYCEKEAEVQVTSVTRSRPCPHCNKGVMIQVAARDRKGKHRALLIATDSKAPLVRDNDVKPVPGPAYEPQPLEGEVFERMKQDPEVRAFRNRLIWGGLVVAILVALTFLWSMFAPVSEAVAVPVLAPSTDKPVAMARPVVSTSAAVPSASPVSPSATPSTANSVLEFQTSGTAKPARASATTPVSAALSAVMKLLQAQNVEQVLDTVADRQALERLIRKYAALHGIKPLPYKALDLAPTSQVPAGCVAAVVITLSDGSKRLANLLAEPKGPLVDWPSFVALSEMSWLDFIEKTPSSPLLFRVLLDDGQRYDNAFSDRVSLQCVKLLNPNDSSSGPLFAYVEKTSSIGEELRYLLRQSDERPLRMTLRLRFPVDPATPDQVWIEGIVTPGWVVPSEPGSTQAAISSE